ncbi:hypothetical protein AB6A40_003862 [Gnathostoma spinigerum]|uniref:Mediator complex subunit 27 n=1 Tax=Gnathostoma spinigerum TaxID=75299 RepID=A0ABD6EAS8_9BILA
MAQPQPNPQQIMQSLSNHVDQCLNAVELLRNEVIIAHGRISSGLQDDDSAETFASFKSLAEEALLRINQIYDTLEDHAKLLPNCTPITPQIERLIRLLNESHIDPYINDIYQKLIDCSTWMENNGHLLQLLTEFGRMVAGNRRRSVVTEKPISFSNFTPKSSPQSTFEQTLLTVLKDPSSKKNGLIGNFLERSTLSSVIEFKFGHNVDKQYVCLLKMLVVVNNGIFEFAQMIAPHEEWSYLDTNNKQVDVLKESRYLVYRKMSVQANIHLMQTIMPYMDIQSPHTISYILNLFAKFSAVFEVKCRFCKKILKDFLPPLMFDLRNPKNAFHESCR